MKYFSTEQERHGTCYHEFYKGKWDEKTFWKDDSLLLHDDILYTLKIDDIFFEVNPDYNPYNETEINKEQWEQICKMAKVIGGEVSEAINEADIWGQETFKEYDVFTILGI